MDQIELKCQNRKCDLFSTVVGAEQLQTDVVFIDSFCPKCYHSILARIPKERKEELNGKV